MAKISVVMAVYNGEARLRETLASIAAQTEGDHELIVVDDGSTDATPRILAAWDDPRLRVITQSNAGLTRALIRGCGEATADVIARHDAGDRSHPERFAKQLALMQEHVLVASATRMLGPGDEELYVSGGGGDETRQALLHADARHIHGIPHHGSAMFRRADYLAAGGYRAAFRFAQDLDLWIRLARRGSIAITEEVLYEARLEPRSISSLHRREQQRLTQIAVNLRDGGDERDLLGEAQRVQPKRRRPNEAAGLYFIAKCLRRNGDPHWRRYLLRALRRNPLHLRAWVSLFGSSIPRELRGTHHPRETRQSRETEEPLKHRLAIVASHVVQYQDPFYRRLAADPALDVTVLFCSDMGARTYLDRDMATSLRWDIDLLEGYEHRFLRNFGFGDGFFRLIDPGLVPAITRGKFDAVLFMTGWAWLSAWIGFAACRMSDTPFLLFGDSSFHDAPTTARARLAMSVKRALFRLAGGFMISGRWNADYYRAHGADPSRFFPMPWAADNERFAAASRFAPGERQAMRARYGLREDETAIVFSAKLIPRKDPMTLLRAVDRAGRRDQLAVLFLGEGELRGELEAFARERNLHAIFAGFVNQTALPRHYAMGDVFCLPSLFEPRGTVINEAMAVGLPILTTNRCGPAGDIVQHGENGFVFTPGDVEALADALDRLTEPELRRHMSERSRAIISTWDYAAGVAGVKQALAAVARR